MLRKNQSGYRKCERGKDVSEGSRRREAGDGPLHRKPGEAGTKQDGAEDPAFLRNDKVQFWNSQLRQKFGLCWN